MGDNAMQELSDAWDAIEGQEETDDGMEPTESTSMVEEGSTDSTDMVAEADVTDAEPEGADSGFDSTGSTASDTPTPADTDTGDNPAGEVEQSADEGPPVGLGAAAREAWKDTPPAMRAEIAKREADFARGIQKYAESAKRATAMDKTLAPFGQYFQMNGGPPAAIQAALQTASLLQMGSPVQKAQATADLIKQFGVDIGALDNLLVGEQAPPELQAQQQVQQAVQQAVAPYQQQMAQLQQMQQAQVAQATEYVNNEVDSFGAQHEFYMDVRADMADLMDLAAQRNMHLSLKEAYDRACMMNPEIQKVIQSRQTQQTLAQKKKAATSVAGTPGGTPGISGEGGLRSTLLDAWEGAGRT